MHYNKEGWRKGRLCLCWTLVSHLGAVSSSGLHRTGRTEHWASSLNRHKDNLGTEVSDTQKKQAELELLTWREESLRIVSVYLTRGHKGDGVTLFTVIFTKTFFKELSMHLQWFNSSHLFLIFLIKVSCVKNLPLPLIRAAMLSKEEIKFTGHDLFSTNPYWPVYHNLILKTLIFQVITTSHAFLRNEVRMSDL